MEKDNPWLSMWCKPRSTIQRVIETNPKQSLWRLAFICGFTSLLNAFQTLPIATQIGFIPMLVLVLVLAPFWGYTIFAIWSWTVLLTGKLLKGKATFVSARAAYAWSCVPLLGNIVLWFALVLFFSSILFFGPQPQVTLSSPALTILFLLLVGKVVFSIWSIVIYLQALAQVQAFSVLRSIVNVIFAAIFFGLLLAIPIVLLVLLGGGDSQQSVSAVLGCNPFYP